MSASPSPLREVWRASIRGDISHRILCDRASGSVFVSDGWGVPLAALRLHRLDLETGAHLADLRTHHQTVGALTLWDRALFVATDSRLLKVDPNDLIELHMWDKRLVRHVQQLVATDEGRLVMANWMRPGIGVVDPSEGSVRRITVGAQPLVVRAGATVRVVRGYDGGMWTLDLEKARLTEYAPTEPMFSIAVGAHVWGVVAGPPQGGQGEPPVWTRRGTDQVQRLDSEGAAIHLSGACDELFAEEGREGLWCVVNGGTALDHADTTTGAVTTYAAQPGEKFCHVDPAAGFAFSTISHRRTEHNRVIEVSATLVCYELPRV